MILEGNNNKILESGDSQKNYRTVMLYIPIILLVLITVFIGFYSEPFFNIANNAASQLLNPAEYINKVLGL